MLTLIKKYLELTQKSAGKKKLDVMNRNQKYTLMMINKGLLDPSLLGFSSANDIQRRHTIVNTQEEWENIMESANGEGMAVYLNFKNEAYLRMNFNNDANLKQKILIAKESTKVIEEMIPYMTFFRDSSEEEKQALLNLEYNDEYNKVFEDAHKTEMQNVLDDYLRKHSQAYKIGLISSIEQDINEKLRDLRNLNRHKVKTVNERINFLFNGESVEATKFISDLDKDVMIKSYKIEQQHEQQLIISLLTEPIYLENYDKLNALKAVENMLSGPKKLQYIAALNDPNTYKIGVGQYKIVLYIDSEGIGYDIVPTQNTQNCANRHWTSHNCLGNYSGSIAQATGNMDLRATTFLLLQFLKTVTIGDGAGDATLFSSSYIINKDKTVIYSNLGDVTNGITEDNIVGLYSDEEIRIQGRPRMRAQGRRGMW